MEVCAGGGWTGQQGWGQRTLSKAGPLICSLSSVATIKEGSYAAWTLPVATQAKRQERRIELRMLTDAWIRMRGGSICERYGLCAVCNFRNRDA